MLALHERSDAQGAAAVLVAYASTAAIFAAMVTWPTVPVILVGTVLLGGRQMAFGVLMHEAAHGTLFATRALNAFVGQWLCAYPIGADMYGYRAIHTRHHRLTGTLQDPDLAIIAPYPMSRGELVRAFARDLSGVTGLMRTAGSVLTDLGFIQPSTAGEVLPVEQAGRSSWDVIRAACHSMGGPALVQGAWLAGLWAAGQPWLFLCWWVARLTLFLAITRVRAIEDHACTPSVEHPLLHSRTVYSSLLERWIVAPYNVSFHLEHHLLPQVPFYNLPRFHRMLVDRGILDDVARATGCLEVLALVGRPTGALAPVRPPGPRRRTAVASPPIRREPGARTGILPRLGGAVAQLAARLRGTREDAHG